MNRSQLYADMIKLIAKGRTKVNAWRFSTSVFILKRMNIQVNFFEMSEIKFTGTFTPDRKKKVYLLECVGVWLTGKLNVTTGSRDQAL